MAIRSTDARTDTIREGDHIFTFNATEKKLKYFLSNGMMQWFVEARGEGSKSGFATDGDTPPGLYQLMDPQWISVKDDHARAVGRWFIPMQPSISRTYVANNRTDLGIHGGGSHLASPLSNQQGWETTRGCIRVQNEDLNKIAYAVQRALKSGSSVWLHVGWETVIDGKKILQQY